MADPGRHRLTVPDRPTVDVPHRRPRQRRGRRARRSRAGWALVAVAALAWTLAVPSAVAAGFTLARDLTAPGLSGRAIAAERIDTRDVPLAIRRVPATGQGPHVPAEEHLVAAVLADLQTFWAATVPAISGHAFHPLRGGLIAVDSAAPSGHAPCVNSPNQIVGNAYYCPSDDGIVYDSSALVPVLLSRYGAPGLVGAFAHEFGHAIQARIGPTAQQRAADPARYPSLLIEAQGDCDAGAFLAWAVAGHSRHVHLDASGMAAAIGPLLDFADPVTVTRSDPTAHGLSLDRLTSVLLGYRKGAAACHAMTVASLHPTLGEVPLPAGGVAALAIPRYPSTAAVLAAARASVTAFRGGSAVTGPPAAPDPAALTAATPFGQFAQATTLALAVGRQVRPTDAGTAPAVWASCFAGAWVASVFGHAAAGQLGSWPGDADEGLDAVRVQPHVTFAAIAAYADGFHDGLADCS